MRARSAWGARLRRSLSSLGGRRIPEAAKREVARDRDGLPTVDPGIDDALLAHLEWMKEAQDRSRPNDGGVARHFSLLHGWSSSYPETTGYIVETMLRVGDHLGIDEPTVRAKRMLDWLVSIQLPGGGFQGGVIGQTPVVPVAFNTGQVLLGLAAGARIWPEFLPAMRKSADWLSDTQDDDGAWRRYSSPFTAAGDKTYDTHIAWGLLEAARVEPNGRWSDAALRNVKWAMRHQRPNGWLSDCCLGTPATPLTHTLGYALRGLIEAYRYLQDPAVLESSGRLARGLLGAMEDNGCLPGRLDASWSRSSGSSCLTGTAQIAICWFLMYRLTSNREFLEAGMRANSYVRRTVALTGPPGQKGGVKGSFPVDGSYGPFQYLNWAAKFSMDAQLLEREIVDPE